MVSVALYLFLAHLCSIAISLCHSLLLMLVVVEALAAETGTADKAQGGRWRKRSRLDFKGDFAVTELLSVS